MYHLPGNVISATVGLVYINLARLVSDNSGSLEKLKSRHRPPQPSLRKNFPHGVRVFVPGYLRVRFDLPSSINFRDKLILGFHRLGPITLIRGYPRGPRVVLDSRDMIFY